MPWDWRSTAEYLDRLEGTLMPNAGFLVGHSAIRRVVMKDAATERAATPEELAADGGSAARGAGGRWARLLVDVVDLAQRPHTGARCRHASPTREELLALCAVVGEHPGTTLEFIPQVGELRRGLHRR